MVGAREALAPPEATSTLLREREALPLEPSPRLEVKPRPGQSQEEAVLHSLARRAARTVRPIIQGVPHHELWVMGFDKDCAQVGLQRLVPGEQGQPFAYLFSALSCAVSMGARAMVLVQNRPGPRRLSTPVDFAPTLKLAAAAHLVGITLVDHLFVPNGGHAPLSLRERRILPEATALGAELEMTLEALAMEHSLVGLPGEGSDGPTTPTLP